MCVICHKPANVRFPSRETINDMWEENPDGAGIMWRDGDKVRWKKGFMDLPRFMKFIEENRDSLESTEVAMHFRITTHGGTNPRNCHPFPMTGKYKPGSLEGMTDVVMMHNGILPIVPRSEKISDTAEFSLRAKETGDPVNYMNMTAEYFSKDNRMVVFAPKCTYFVGAWKKRTVDDGCSYSNLNFEWGLSYYRHGGYTGWEYSPSGTTGTNPDDVPTQLYHWNDRLMSFVDRQGVEVDIMEVDPDMLETDLDYQVYEDLWGAEMAGLEEERERERIRELDKAKQNA